MKYDFSHLTLLYVEDDDIIREQAVLYLQNYFLKVFEAEDGIKALSIYHEFKPDIIIADIKMPRLDGLGFASKIREEDIKTPLIITTAYSDNPTLLKALNLQLTYYITKPVDPKKLHLALELSYEQLYGDMASKVRLSKELFYEPKSMEITYKNSPVKLTKNELLLLDLLVKNHQRVVHYNEIANRIWYDSGVNIDSLRSLVRSIRKKLTSIELENVSGIGYRIYIH